MTVHLPQNIKRIEDILEENPAIKKIAKYLNPKKFKRLDFVVFSQPQSHPDHTVYGLYVLNKKGILDNLIVNLNKYPEIKQDFIVLDRTADSAIYYSGGTNASSGDYQSITSFCSTYGRWPNGNWGQYECTSGLITPLHHYKDETATNLPSEQFIKDEIKKTMHSFKSSWLTRLTVLFGKIKTYFSK